MLTNRTLASSANASAAAAAMCHDYAVHDLAAGDHKRAVYWQQSAARWNLRAQVARVRLATGCDRHAALAHIAFAA